jgi:hypothetical protein
MESAESSPAERPAVWFSQAEEQFALAGVNNERTNFYQVISQLNQQHSAEIVDIITNPPQKSSCSTLRTELVNRLAPFRKQRIRQFLALERETSQPLRHLRSLSSDVPDTSIRSIWSSLLPCNVRTILSGHPERGSKAEARCADRTAEPTLEIVAPPTDSNELPQRTENLSRQVKARSAGRARSRYNPKDRRSNSRNPRQAAKFNSTMFLPPAAEPAQETSTAPHVYTENSGLLFITDRCSKHQFLVDTGSDICVFPRKLVPQRKERGNFYLFAANGTPIPTYGMMPLSLNMGLRRHFTWRFVVADVSHPLIGADFLSHFGLLVDCRNNRLLDGITTFDPAMKATPAIAPPTTSPTQPLTRTTRSGRHVRLPSRFNA